MRITTAQCLAGFAALCLSALPVSEAMSEEAFTIAVIPDTQIQSLSDAWNESFRDQVNWITQNIDSHNIKLATHVGDVAQGALDGLETFVPEFSWENQLQRTAAVIDLFDDANTSGSLPYSISAGNHDFLPRGDKTNGDDPISPTGFTANFGGDRYNGYSWYGGGDTTGLNHYQMFEANGHTYMHLNLEYKPENPAVDPDLSRGGFTNALEWAQSILDANPGIPTIISTHEYLTDLGPDGHDASGYQGDGFDNTFGGQRTGTGEAVWQQLVRSNSQIFMTLNGHDHEGPYREDGEFSQISTNDAGLPVFEIVANYQDYVNPLTGSDPYLRLIEFDPDAGEIRNKTFNPTFAAFLDDPSAFTDRLDEVLDQFEAGVPISDYEGEEFSQIILSDAIPGNATIVSTINFLAGGQFAVLGSRADAEQLILDFFGVATRDDLATVDLADFLTDADSQFTYEVSFDADGRPVPIPEPASLTLLGIGGLLLTRRRR